ncbi:hypothetical protein MMC21_005172 [Puttea exsequens]|nr:hypothetical protein [Puttea exsequens]
MERHEGFLHIEEESKQMPKIPWLSSAHTLDVITDAPVQPNFPPKSHPSPQQLTDPDESIALGRASLGEIWQTLGAMILKAADQSAEDPSYTAILTHVFQILAHLHRIDAFPSTIYNYDAAVDQTVIQRPPTLYLLSKVIMSRLSDLEWASQWQGDIAKYKKLGYDLEPLLVPPRIREFGPELWLDLILWACVEGRWIKEGAWIVAQMNKRRAKNTQWTVIGWQEISQRKRPKPSLSAVIKLEVDKARLHQIGIETAAGQDFTVEMGERKVSREVILAILDGLLGIPSNPNSDPGSEIVPAKSNITSCRDLLERHNGRLTDKVLNVMILRSIESSGIDSSILPAKLRNILNLRLTSRDLDRPADPSISAQDSETDDFAPFLGLLHRNLHGFADQGNAQGSLEIFSKLQDVVDRERDIWIRAFAEKITKNGAPAEERRFSDDNSGHSNPSAADPQIPVSTLAAFLDLITNSKLFELGKWLLFNQDADGSAVDATHYADPNLQAALLRFATATGDKILLTRILENLASPPSESVLHAVLRCQVALGKWGRTEELLQHFQRSRNMAWEAADAMAIARSILQMEQDRSYPEIGEDITKAARLLQCLVDGKYNNAQNPSQLPDYSQIRLAHQLVRIFQSIPGALSALNYQNSGFAGSGRAQTSIMVDSSAFNILLETVVECRGALAGQLLWQRWCLNPSESPQVIRAHKSPMDPATPFEAVITPTVAMLRNILPPAHFSKQRAAAWILGRDTFQEDDDIQAQAKQKMDGLFGWAIIILKKFGLSETEIAKEIPYAHVPTCRLKEIWRGDN